MAGLPYLIPTARYKRAVKVGNTVTFRTEDAVADNGIITDLYWSTDLAGHTRVANIDELTDFYLQVRTQNIYTTVSISMESTIDSEGLVEGIVDQIYAVPITANPQNGVGYGAVKYNIEEDEDVFKNSTYVNVTAQRALNTEYTNTTGKSIMVNITVDDTNDRSPTIQIFVGGALVISDNYDNNTARVTGSWSFVVPPNQTYRANALSFTPRLVTWSECRPNGT